MDRLYYIILLTVFCQLSLTLINLLNFPGLSATKGDREGVHLETDAEINLSLKKLSHFFFDTFLVFKLVSCWFSIPLAFLVFYVSEVWKVTYLQLA